MWMMWQFKFNTLSVSRGKSLLFQSRLCTRNLQCKLRQLCTESNHQEEIPELDEDFKKRIFNSKLRKIDPTTSYKGRRAILLRERKKRLEDMVKAPTRSLCAHLLEESENEGTEEQTKVVEVTEAEIVSYPYSLKIKDSGGVSPSEEKEPRGRAFRMKALRQQQQRSEALQTWLSDYEFYNEKEAQQEHLSDIVSSGIFYGTADPSKPVSSVPCGGCGALLHCQNPSIPGYIPKQIFSSRSKEELRSMICQRCHFMREFNIALGVNVSPHEYPKILSQIKEKRAIVILMVDLLDFPCSIWPGIMDIIGKNMPVVIVGNKIDLIPGDHHGYLNHITKVLQDNIEKMGVGSANIKFTALISAQTGFGVEDLITRLHGLWRYKSDVYLVGCTNVGKSTLFNTLIQSDFCKVQAVDHVRRATISTWPGTTLNLLKFPILRLEGYRVAERMHRLKSEKDKQNKEKILLREQLKRNRMYHMCSFYQYVGRTFPPYRSDQDETEMHRLRLNTPKQGDGKSSIGIDDSAPDFAQGRWCYDTPGVVHPDQILDLLTTEELLKVLPRKAITPRFFTLKPGKSIFIAGLCRLDFLSSPKDYSARFTVFSSEDLPITVSETVEADYVYNKLLGSPLMAVPCGGPKRMAEWPGLKPKEEILKIVGINYKRSCADIILSSAGWISIAGEEAAEMCFQAWTPSARGIHVRCPSLLPYAISFKGKRIDHTPTYTSHRADGKLFTGKHFSGSDLLNQ